MKIHAVLILGLLSISLLGMAPSESNYSSIPKKRDMLGSNENVREIRDESVRPEQVYKYGVQEFAIVATDTGFLPQRIIVRNNIPVRLFVTSASSRSYCFMMDEFSIRKGVPSQEVVEIRFLPKKSETYRFYCPVQEIEGTIVVRD